MADAVAGAWIEVFMNHLYRCCQGPGSVAPPFLGELNGLTHGLSMKLLACNGLLTSHGPRWLWLNTMVPASYDVAQAAFQIYP
jgi:hypothetical protein